MLNWIISVAAAAHRLRRQSDLDTQADHARKTSDAIAARAEARRLSMLAKMGEQVAKREPRERGLCYPQRKF